MHHFTLSRYYFTKIIIYIDHDDIWLQKLRWLRFKIREEVTVNIPPYNTTFTISKPKHTFKHFALTLNISF